MPCVIFKKITNSPCLIQECRAPSVDPHFPILLPHHVNSHCVCPQLSFLLYVAPLLPANTQGDGNGAGEWGPDIFGWEEDGVEEGRGAWKLWRLVLLSVCIIMAFSKALSSFYAMLKEKFNNLLTVLYLIK